MWGNFFKEYFTFSRGQRNGIFVLLLIIIILIVLPHLMEFFKHQQKIDFTQFQKEIAEFEKQQVIAKEKKFKLDTASFELFSFNPNEITETDWRRLGVSERTARTIMNYRNKGGHFNEKEDLLKIYGFDTAKYEILEPYIAFRNDEKPEFDPFDKAVFKKPEEKKQYQKEKFSYEKKSEYKPKENVIVELNSADTTELVKVRGIGPTLSRRIIKYRDKLGGFVGVDQLMEVYGMDSVWFETMKPSLIVDSSRVTKVAVNSVLPEDLEKHPYFGRNIARAIVNFRQQHGSFRSVEDLKKIYVIDENLFERIEPYVMID